MEPVTLRDAEEKAIEYTNHCVAELKKLFNEKTDDILLGRLMDLFTTHLLRPKAITNREELSPLLELFEPASTLTLEKVSDMLIQGKAIFRGHFELLSGYHTPYFFRFSELTGYSKDICQDIISRLDGLQRFDAILASTSAGGILGSVLSRDLKVKLAYVDVGEDGRPVKLRPGTGLRKGARVLLVNDMITTGQSILNLAEIVNAESCKIMAIAVFAIRGNHPQKVKEFIESRTSSKVFATVKMKLHVVPPEKCQLCERQIPVYYSKDLNR